MILSSKLLFLVSDSGLNNTVSVVSYKLWQDLQDQHQDHFIATKPVLS